MSKGEILGYNGNYKGISQKQFVVKRQEGVNLQTPRMTKTYSGKATNASAAQILL